MILELRRTQEQLRHLKGDRDRRREYREAEELLNDPEMGEMAREEYAAAREALADMEVTLRKLLLPKDPDKIRPLIGRDVADPWYTGDFGATWRDIVEGCTAIMEEFA